MPSSLTCTIPIIYIHQPTNHLDADTVRALCDALSTYEVLIAMIMMMMMMMMMMIQVTSHGIVRSVDHHLYHTTNITCIYIGCDRGGITWRVLREQALASTRAGQPTRRPHRPGRALGLIQATSEALRWNLPRIQEDHHQEHLRRVILVLTCAVAVVVVEVIIYDKSLWWWLRVIIDTMYDSYQSHRPW